MALLNYPARELTAKVVYYGPGLCGKTTNLLYIHQNLPEEMRGKMLSLPTKTDRTLLFDLLPIDLGRIAGLRMRLQVCTVPGQVFYNETRRLVLKGTDGIVFVADSQEQMLATNIESFHNLEENLKAHGMALAEIPHVLQFNKRDLPSLSSVEELNTLLNKYNVPLFESVASTGIGVQDTLKAIAKLVLFRLNRKYKVGATNMAAAAGVQVASVRSNPVSGFVTETAAHQGVSLTTSSGLSPRPGSWGTGFYEIDPGTMSDFTEEESREPSQALELAGGNAVVRYTACSLCSPPTSTPFGPTAGDQLQPTICVTRTGTKYHRPGCRHLSKSRVSISLGSQRLG